ncbi:NADPH-dependent FMN reductase [Herbaspirillum sp. alder98]|uniref:NADPH-dependent FMN reductase n=1 Tax=Herbaspirillum sp. alder98 TaxID=2913096 RepID=UPI001CD8DCC2|nr:NAD(P)H-dependent oxidoreductase [Herbaspirillum sp. alder98]MCA1326682.1 NAD(P)H-dependent oxidoreductase [Herbaspirillum sp. alder98]
MSQTDVKILGISGSLRAKSINTAALRALYELLPPGVTLTEADISDLPLYNDDVREQGWPAPVARLRQQIAEADAIIFATPEYNYSIPGVLKNAIDWASRPPEQPFAGKFAAIMGASPGAIGTARAQYHLRQIGVFLDLQFINKPEVMIGGAADRFDANGKLTHEPTREFLKTMVTALADRVRFIRKAQQG